jgi:predicted anti-sigma-YlaC factor YlaD
MEPIAFLCVISPSRALGVWAAIGAGIGFLLLGEYVPGAIAFAVVLLNAAVFLMGRHRGWFRFR